jgi:hypothetical protein
MTLYHWLFAGQSGIDPYSVASSEVYQDLFGEGTFTGKGLLDVQAVHAVLGGRLPPSQVLSHDLLEGSLARCAAVTDVAGARGRAVPCRRRGVSRAPLDPWRLAAAADPAPSGALPDRRGQPLEDDRQPAPLARRAGVARPARGRPRDARWWRRGPCSP